jgi:DNA modification methylase
LERKKLSDLSPNPRNPRKISDPKLAMMKKSLDEFGELNCILFNRKSGHLVSGHQRNKVLPPDSDIIITQEYDTPTRTGTVAEGHVIVAGDKFKVRFVDWSDTKENAAMIAANKHGGEWDFPALNDIMLELDQTNFDMELTGYDEFEIEDQMTYVRAHERTFPGEGEDDIPEAPRETIEETQTRLERIVIPEIMEGDCLDVLKTLPENHVEAMVTDPPAGISFMGKDWDKDKGGRDAWVAWMSEVMRECLRVLKPGAHALVWAIPRTSHWTATALEDAGFEIRDVVTHLFGSGFPKSLDISKAIDKAAGATREVIGKKSIAYPDSNCWSEPNKNKDSIGFGQGTVYGEAAEGWSVKNNPLTAPSTREAKLWQGFGTALKPASEHWILCRKPCSEKTVAANVLKWGCGGLNIDASRVATEDNLNGGAYSEARQARSMTPNGKGERATLIEKEFQQPQGRFPANLVLSHNEDCVEVGVKKVKGQGGAQGGSNIKTRNLGFGDTKGTRDYNLSLYNPDGTETVAAWECSEGCAVACLDDQSGDLAGRGSKLKDDEMKGERHSTFNLRKRAVQLHENNGGGASRFFYVAKASKRERNAGCEGLPEKAGALCTGAHRPNKPARLGANPHSETSPKVNHHPTVKPLKLMTYLIRMVTPPNGIVLDPFCGSGSTGVAAGRDGFKFLGIENDPEYVQIARHRFANEMSLSEDEITSLEGEEEIPDGDLSLNDSSQ